MSELNDLTSVKHDVFLYNDDIWVRSNKASNIISVPTAEAL